MRYDRAPRLPEAAPHGLSLYYAPGAASMVVHWLLIELDVPHELHLVDTKPAQQKSPEYLALNPNGVVPTLVLDGMPRFEAAALLMTLADRASAARASRPRSTIRGARDYHQWMFHLANAVQPLFRQWWYPHEPAGEAQADAVRAQRARRASRRRGIGSTRTWPRTARTCWAIA